MSKYLADTTVVVAMLRGDERTRRFLEDLPEISAVTVVELIQGCESRNDLRVVEKTCTLLPQVRIDLNISSFAIELLKKYYLSHNLLFLDALVAASAILRKKILVTANIKDFRFINGLEVMSHDQAFGKQ